MTRAIFRVAFSLVAVLSLVHEAYASSVTGTISFSGTVSGLPIGAITASDITVSVKTTAEATEGGEDCTLGAITSDTPDDPSGAYPGMGGGMVNVSVTLDKGGPNPPSGSCLLTVQASGVDPMTSTSARGSAVVLVNATQISGDATISPVDITVAQSKAVASISDDCLKWSKKQLKKRAKCNYILLKLGGTDGAPKCKDACFPDPSPCEPVNCDPGNIVETVLAFAHDGNDQQALPDPSTAQGVDTTVLGDQVKCQKRFGFGAANYMKKRNALVESKCLNQNLDSQACRDTQSQAAKKKLDTIAKCVGDQDVDVSMLVVPDVKDPCSSQCIAGGVIDTKCMRSCFQSVLDGYSDLMIGDIPVCGNGITQPPEECDDGGTMAGDGCDATCQLEVP